MKQSYRIRDRQNHSGLHKAEEPQRDIGSFLSSIPGWVLFTTIVILYTLILALGNYVGYQRFLAGVKQPVPPTDAAVGSVLALLAFMLSFAFSSAWTRFIRRNGYVIGHANAIRTCYLRAGFITEGQAVRVRKLLTEYTELLLNIYTTTDLNKAMPRINSIHFLLWQEATSLVTEDIDSELRSLFVASVNDLINIAAERKTVALFVRIPNVIWTCLLVLAAIGLLAFGYQEGASGVNNLFQVPLLPVAFGLVIVLISDLNSRDSKARFQVTKRPLKEVLAMIGEDIP